ncbi:MAG: hypothetical protein HYX90_08985 [Chloroflexi bacterium]|nr:hypothetical protein [Chloroflexota bacterium]
MTADGLALEKKGIPAAVVGNRKLVDTTGKATARAHGLPEYPFVVLADDGTLMTMMSAEEMGAAVDEAIPQIEKILLK